MAELEKAWRMCFFETVRSPETAGTLRDSSAQGDMKAWTASLTTAVVKTCLALGWRAAAKGHRLDLLPVPRSEYLSLDAVAFSDEGGRWRFPKAIIELENNVLEDRIAYSLWKTLCVRADLRMVFCYRKNIDEAAPLVRRLCDHVIAGMKLDHLANLHGETIVVVGSRGEANTFPYGFFKWWRLNTGLAKFETI